MKKVFYVCMTLVFMKTSVCAQQGMSINTTGGDPDTSAMLDVTSTNKGVLFPRLTTAQRDAISLPATGLLLFNITTNTFDYYTGSAWISLSTVSTTPSVPIIRTYTTNATWTKPANLKYIIVEMVGGGGGGGGCSSYSGGSGAGGGYTKKIIDANLIISSVTILVGIAGTGGSPQSSGGDGGTTSFGSFCSATGGQGGVGQNAITLSSFGASPGIGSNGDINISGQGSGGVVGASQPPYPGGSSQYGGGSPANPSSYVAADGTVAKNYGSGGSGGTCYGASGHSGGSGSGGVVIITEYY